MKSNNKNHVLQLVGIKEDNKQLYLTQQGKLFLQSVRNPISIVSIAGLYRTGKSYLVNKLLQRCNFNEQLKQDKFNVSNTVRSCTKGINVWSIPFDSNNSNQAFSYIILDSQGVGSIQKQVTYDMNLMMLIFLISSTVIYNSVGPIDQVSLDQLRVVVNLKKSFEKNNQSQPRFLWVLRDFALQLMNRKGQIISQNRYLQESLQTIPSSNKQTIKKNEIRQAIRQNLPNRQCYTLVRPTIKQDELRNLIQLDDKKIRKQFLDKINQLYDSIFRNNSQDIKYLNEKHNYVTGQILVNMIQFYLNQINNNRIPQVGAVWQLIQSNQFQQVMEQCQHRLKTQSLKIDLPISQQQLKSKLNQIQNTIFQSCQHNFTGDIQTYKKFINKFNQLTTKLNSKLLKANNDIKRKKVMKYVRDLINKQIQFDKIQPWQVMQIKSTVEKINLKNIGADTQIYEYVVNTLFDVMEISQNKVLKLKDQILQLQNQKQQGQYEQKQNQQQILKLKHDYNEALKQVNLYKKQILQHQHKLAILQQNLQNIQIKYSSLTKQKTQSQLLLRTKNQQLNQKIKRKQEEYNDSIKKLRVQNQNLTVELDQVKKQLNQKKLNQRKQVIFQQKIKSSWDRFEQQRNFLKNQLQKYKHLYLEKQQKQKSLEQKLFKSQNLLKSQKQCYNKKQKQFCDQLRWMKQNISKSKEVYNQSLNTKLENQRILQDITLGSKKRNLMIQNQNGWVDTKSYIQQKTSIQNLIQTIKHLKNEKQVLISQIKDLKLKNQRKFREFQQTQKLYKKQTTDLQQKLLNLQQQTKLTKQSSQLQKNKFYHSLKQIEQSKQAERKMYQQSILRLLNNIQNTSMQMENQSCSNFYKTNEFPNRSTQFSINSIESTNLHRYANKSQKSFSKYKKDYR